jgi:hypothetical protein
MRERLEFSNRVALSLGTINKKADLIVVGRPLMPRVLWVIAIDDQAACSSPKYANGYKGLVGPSTTRFYGR